MLVLACEFVCEILNGDWSIGGSGRGDISGNGFDDAKELGVDVAFEGGHSRRGGNSGTFSLVLSGLSDDVEECLSFSLSRSLSLSLLSPRLRRLRKAFMVAIAGCSPTQAATATEDGGMRSQRGERSSGRVFCLRVEQSWFPNADLVN